MIIRRAKQADIDKNLYIEGNDEIHKFAKDNDCKRVEFNCWNFNSDALEFYNKLGFIEQIIVFEKEDKK